MGNSCSCFKRDDKEYNDHLIRDKYCPKCRVHYLSNNEYNKHIIDCNQIHGDM